jgi:hypothetical protein
LGGHLGTKLYAPGENGLIKIPDENSLTDRYP